MRILIFFIAYCKTAVVAVILILRKDNFFFKLCKITKQKIYFKYSETSVLSNMRLEPSTGSSIMVQSTTTGQLTSKTGSQDVKNQK